MTKILFISFYDSIALGIRTLSSLCKLHGIESSVILFKDERTKIVDEFKESAKYYQILVGVNKIGCGEDVNPPTEKEFQILEKKVKEINPDVIGISGRSATKNICKTVVIRLRSIVKNVVFVGGGYGPSLQPEVFLEFLNYVVIGEGEKFIKQLDKKNIKNIPGICYLEDDLLKVNTNSNVANLNHLPFPDRENKNIFLIEDDEIKNNTNTGTAYDIFTSRGCPSNCTYCLACQWRNILKPYNQIYPKWRQRSINSVISELKEAKAKYNIQIVRFKDSIFTVNKRWIIEFMKSYNREIGLSFHCFLDERFVDEDIIKILKDSGMKLTTVGIQSTSEVIREKILGRKITNLKLLNYALLLNKYDVQIKYDILGWNPFETNTTLNEGFNFLRNFPKGIVTTVYQIKSFPKTEFEEKLKKIKNQLSFEDYYRWALLFQMVLHSSYMEKIATQIVNMNYNSNIINKIFQSEISSYDDGFRLIYKHNCKKGSKLKVSDIEFVKGNGSGIKRHQIDKLLHHPLNQDVDKGRKILWTDIFSSYENIQEFYIKS